MTNKYHIVTNKYRIVTNKNTFRVQKRCIVGIFKKQTVWRNLGRYVPPFIPFYPNFEVTEYTTYKEAKAHIDNILMKQEIEEGPWVEVNE